jgi:hypothetical protein
MSRSLTQKRESVSIFASKYLKEHSSEILGQGLGYSYRNLFGLKTICRKNVKKLNALTILIYKQFKNSRSIQLRKELQKLRSQKRCGVLFFLSGLEELIA